MTKFEHQTILEDFNHFAFWGSRYLTTLNEIRESRLSMTAGSSDPDEGGGDDQRFEWGFTRTFSGNQDVAVK